MNRHLDAMSLVSRSAAPERRFVARGKVQIAAFSRQRIGDDKADALRGAGDEGALAFEIDVHGHPSLVDFEDFAGKRGAHDLGRAAGDQIAARAPPHGFDRQFGRQPEAP